MTINIAHVEYKTLKKHILVIIALFFSTLVLVSNANAVEPVLVLDPSTGDPSSVSGTSAVAVGSATQAWLRQEVRR